MPTPKKIAQQALESAPDDIPWDDLLERLRGEQRRTAPRSHARLGTPAAVTAGVIGVFALIMSVMFYLTEETTRKLILGAWVIGPPTWFFVEYWLFTSEAEKDSEAFMRRLKNAQELAAKFWIAASVVLAALYFNLVPIKL